MNARTKKTHSDWLLGGFMFLLCAGLTVLQYRWTGAIANAELVRLRGNLEEQARAFTRAFDLEFSSSCEQLMPSREDFSSLGIEAAHLARLKSWQGTNPRPMFSRIALIESEEAGLQCSLLDPAKGNLARVNWPEEWSELRQNLTGKLSGGGSPPFRDERGMLMEIPMFTVQPPSRNGGGPPLPGDFHWLVLEMDASYARQTWLPELAAKYLNPDGHLVNEVRVRPLGVATNLIYATQTEGSDPAAEVSIRFNGLSRPDNGGRGPFMGGPFGQAGGGRWLLEAWHRPGVLESVVSASRRRNLAVAVVLNGLMLATGIALVRHTRRSRQLAEAQMNFVANVSHELRTPLTVIRGAAHNMKRGIVHERGQIAQYSGLILQHTEQLTSMVEQLLELASGRKQRPTPEFGPVAVGEILQDAIAAAREDAQAAGCSVELEIPPELPAISGDAGALRRVFQNLLTNAAKHGGAGGWIGVTAKVLDGAEGARVEVRVTDRGTGIPESEQAEIFKPFVRGALAEAKQVRGSGLGLSVVQETVQLHRGSVSVSSKPGQGATFIVRLPVAPAFPE